MSKLVDNDVFDGKNWISFFSCPYFRVLPRKLNHKTFLTARLVPLSQIFHNPWPLFTRGHTNLLYVGSINKTPATFDFFLRTETSSERSQTKHRRCNALKRLLLRGDTRPACIHDYEIRASFFVNDGHPTCVWVLGHTGSILLGKWCLSITSQKGRFPPFTSHSHLRQFLSLRKRMCECICEIAHTVVTKWCAKSLQFVCRCSSVWIIISQHFFLSHDFVEAKLSQVWIGHQEFIAWIRLIGRSMSMTRW